MFLFYLLHLESYSSDRCYIFEISTLPNRSITLHTAKLKKQFKSEARTALLLTALKTVVLFQTVCGTEVSVKLEAIIKHT